MLTFLAWTFCLAESLENSGLVLSNAVFRCRVEELREHGSFEPSNDTQAFDGAGIKKRGSSAIASTVIDSLEETGAQS